MTTRRDRIEALAKALGLMEYDSIRWIDIHPGKRELLKHQAADLLTVMTRAGIKVRLKGEK